jgi:PLP dependent protein
MIVCPNRVPVLAIARKASHKRQHTMDPVNALRHIRQTIAAAERDAGRDHGSVTLIAVSKTFDASAIVPILATGQWVFGENRVQEAQKKWPDLKRDYSGIELHLIGPLQSNKAADAVTLFDVIQTVDREKIADALAREIRRSGHRPRLLIQVNTGRETQKAGIDPDDADRFIAYCRAKPELAIEGLMCIPPADDSAPKHFALLRDIAVRNDLPVLSMGMSSDYITAIAGGATHVRVGSAIFGVRPTGQFA